MTQQIELSPIPVSPSLAARVRRFAGALTPEEQAQVRAMQPHDVTGLRPPSLWAKAQQVTEALTAKERDELRRMLTGAVVRRGRRSDDVAGYRAAEYEDEFGYKGHPGSNIQPIGGGGGFNLMHIVYALGILQLTAGIIQGPNGQGGWAPRNPVEP
jgi:hypothetical protein